MKKTRQLVFVEEPENGLYHQYLANLAIEMKRDQVWVLEKDVDGFSTAKQAASHDFVKELVDEGASMGDLWYSKYFG